jgi:hypothetical protein
MAGYKTWLVPCSCEWRDWCHKYQEDCWPCHRTWISREIRIIGNKLKIKRVEAQVVSLEKEEKAAKHVSDKAKRKHEAAAAATEGTEEEEGRVIYVALCLICLYEHHGSFLCSTLEPCNQTL